MGQLRTHAVLRRDNTADSAPSRCQSPIHGHMREESTFRAGERYLCCSLPNRLSAAKCVSRRNPLLPPPYSICLSPNTCRFRLPYEGSSGDRPGGNPSGRCVVCGWARLVLTQRESNTLPIGSAGAQECHPETNACVASDWDATARNDDSISDEQSGENESEQRVKVPDSHWLDANGNSSVRRSRQGFPNSLGVNDCCKEKGNAETHTVLVHAGNATAGNDESISDHHSQR